MKNGPRWAVALFFAAFLLIGLFTAADYGPTWDEQDDMDILRMNLWEYSRFFGLDESAYENRAANANGLTISALTPISESIEQDHGIAAFYPMAGVVMGEGLTEGQRSQYWHMWCWVIFTLGALALYGVCCELGLSRGYALLGPVMLLLSPQFFAHGHFNNKDIALMSLALCVLWQGLRLMKKPAFSTALLFSFCGALAANTKVAGAALWGLCALFVLIQQIIQKNLNLRVWMIALVTAVSFFVFYALLTPALWASPMAFIRYLVGNALSFSRWQNSLLFRGTVFELWRESLPRYYLPYMVLATTPLWVLLLMAVGIVCVLCRRSLPLVLTALMAILPLAFAVLTRTHVYNGWRHFYFVYGPMLALAAVGFHQLLQLRFHRLMGGLLAVCMLFTGVGIILQHPHQQAYYQPLVQLRGTDFNELDYWNVSARGALEKLAQETQGDIAIRPADLWTEDALQKAILTLDDDTAARFTVAEDATYVLVNPTYANFSHFDASGMECAVRLTAYGQPIMEIYKGDEP